MAGCNKKGRYKLWADDGDAVFWPVKESHIEY